MTFNRLAPSCRQLLYLKRKSHHELSVLQTKQNHRKFSVFRIKCHWKLSFLRDELFTNRRSSCYNFCPFDDTASIVMSCLQDEADYCLSKFFFLSKTECLPKGCLYQCHNFSLQSKLIYISKHTKHAQQCKYT